VSIRTCPALPTHHHQFLARSSIKGETHRSDEREALNTLYVGTGMGEFVLVVVERFAEVHLQFKSRSIGESEVSGRSHVEPSCFHTLVRIRGQGEETHPWR
jgi:hypothetical protein